MIFVKISSILLNYLMIYILIFSGQSYNRFWKKLSCFAIIYYTAVNPCTPHGNFHLVLSSLVLTPEVINSTQRAWLSEWVLMHLEYKQALYWKALTSNGSQKLIKFQWVLQSWSQDFFFCVLLLFFYFLHFSVSIYSHPSRLSTVEMKSNTSLKVTIMASVLMDTLIQFNSLLFTLHCF